MMALTVATAVAVALALARPGSPARARRRLGTSATHVQAPRGAGLSRPPDWSVRLLGSAGVSLAVLAVVGGPPGWVGALGTGILAWAVLGRLEKGAVRRRRAAVRRDLPFAADLLVTCLAAGATPARGFGLVGAAVGGPLGAALTRASAVLALGAPASEAFAAWRADPSLADLEAVARLVERATDAGTGLAASAAQLATDLRAERRWRVDEIARRAGVRATAPLGACFLPAFVLLGVVPVVLWGMRSVT